MNSLITIFEGLTYPQVLDIAEEFYFHTDVELGKNEFERRLAKFLVNEGYEKEVTSRYEKNPDLETTKPERAVDLFNFQVARKNDMIEGFEQHITFLNSSEPGTGKTYVSISLAETEKRPIIIICPKQVMLTWYMLCVKSEVEILCICNYEMFITGNMYLFSGKVDLEKLPKVENPYLRRIETKGRGAKKTVEFEWKNLPEKTMIVFDEAHYCKNLTALRTKLMLGAYSYARHPENRWKHINILLLSATIIEKKSNLIPFMYVLGYARSLREKTIVEDPDFSVKEFGYKLLSERRMTRATMKEAREALGDFHTSDIRTKMFKLEEKDRQRIQELCEEIRKVLQTGEGKMPKNHLAIRLQARQEIEAIKMGIFVEEYKKLKDKYAVVLFVNFIESHKALTSLIRKEFPDEMISSIKGGQGAYERLQEIENFQKGVSNVMISMIGAGGTGIGLHDVNATKPRYGLHSPSESATQMVQTLGRLDRLGSKSDSVQRIVFIAGTIEEKMAEGLLKKMKTISELNGEDEFDNIFLFDKIHSYEETERTPIKLEKEAGEIKVVTDKSAKQIVVSVPNYMVDAFEKGLPSVTIASMQIDGDRYRFSIEHLAIIQEFLHDLTR